VSALEPRIEAYLRHVLPDAEDVRIDEFARIHGGASRETYRLRLRYRADGAELERRLILRRDPPGSLIDTDRRDEFNAYRAFHGTDVPVPEALWLEEDASWLDYPFFVMEELRGFEASPQAILLSPYVEKAEHIAQQKWTILGAIAAADPAALGLLEQMEAVPESACWKRELDYWEGVIDEDELEPQPIARAAIRWLRRNPPPPPARLSVVHGDYRTGNFLYDSEGTIRGILDWEMSHLGDPLEDLAWSINRVWCWGRDERVGGLVPREQAIRIWEQAVGRRADPAGLHWWELFSSVKGQGIWTSSAREYLDGSNRDPILALSGWLIVNAQDRAALETMGRLEL
jgi:aminoglycoside phosphotransferase (APT) family kinase protein